MKTGMEYPMIGLVVLVALAFAWQAWSGLQVDLAVASTNATIAGAPLPQPVMVGGQWVVNAVVGVFIGGAVSAFIAWLVVWAKRNWAAVNSEQRWKSGPNANWGRQQPGAPKVMSEAELYRLMLMQQMTGGGAGQRKAVYSTVRPEGDDEPTINL